MFWEKRFKLIDKKIADVCEDVVSAERNAKLDAAKRVNELKKEIGRRLEEDNVDDLKWKSLQSEINEGNLKNIKLALDEITLLKKQVAALIETHPNVAMYQGVFNRPEFKKSDSVSVKS